MILNLPALNYFTSTSFCGKIYPINDAVLTCLSIINYLLVSMKHQYPIYCAISRNICDNLYVGCGSLYLTTSYFVWQIFSVVLKVYWTEGHVHIAHLRQECHN